MNRRPASADFHSLHSRHPATITAANGLVQQFSSSDGTGGIQYAATPQGGYSGTDHGYSQ